MKSLIKAAVVAVAFAAPVLSFAQQQQPLTRAQVRDELVQLRAAGYDPADWIHYPENIQAAEAKLAAQHAAHAYGPSTDGASQSGQ